MEDADDDGVPVAHDAAVREIMQASDAEIAERVKARADAGGIIARGWVVRVLAYRASSGGAYRLVLFRVAATLQRGSSLREDLPAYIGIDDWDTLATLSPAWTQTVQVTLPAAASEDNHVFVPGHTAEAKALRKADPGCAQGNGARAPRFRAFRMEQVPVLKTGNDTTCGGLVLSRPQARAMLEGTKPLPELPIRQTYASLLAVFRQVTDKPGVLAQLHDCFVPRVCTVLSAWLRPSCARTLTLPEARALAGWLLARAKPQAEGFAACRRLLIGAEIAHYGDPGSDLPRRHLSLQRGNKDEHDAEEKRLFSTLAYARASLMRCRSLPMPSTGFSLVDAAAACVLSAGLAEAAGTVPWYGRSWCGPAEQGIDLLAHAGTAGTPSAHVVICVTQAATAACAKRIRLETRDDGYRAVWLGDVLAGAVSTAGWRAVDLTDAHLVGCETLVALSACLPDDTCRDRQLIGDGEYALGAYDGHDGGAPLRDGLAARPGVLRPRPGEERWPTHGSFGCMLPTAAHTAALFTDRAPVLAAATTDFASPQRKATTNVPEFVLVAGGPAWPTVTHHERASERRVRAGDWLLMADEGRVRQVASVGRAVGSHVQGLSPAEGAHAVQIDELDAVAILCAGPEGTPSHRECCALAGNPDNSVRLALHARRITPRASRLPVRLAASALTEALPGNVTLQGVNALDSGAGLSIDDLRAACKLVGPRALPLTCTRVGPDLLCTREPNRARSRLPGLLRGEYLIDGQQVRGLLDWFRARYARRHAALQSLPPVGFSVRAVHATATPVGYARDDDDDDDDWFVDDDTEGYVFAGPPTPEQLASMTHRDLDQCLRARVEAIADALRETPSGAAVRYPHSAEMANMIPEARALFHCDQALRERVAVFLEAKMFRGTPALEGFFLDGEQALCHIRTRNSHTAARHRQALVRLLAGMSPLPETSGDEADGLVGALQGLRVQVTESLAIGAPKTPDRDE